MSFFQFNSSFNFWPLSSAGAAFRVDEEGGGGYFIYFRSAPISHQTRTIIRLLAGKIARKVTDGTRATGGTDSIISKIGTNSTRIGGAEGNWSWTRPCCWPNQKIPVIHFFFQLTGQFLSFWAQFMQQKIADEITHFPFDSVKVYAIPPFHQLPSFSLFLCVEYYFDLFFFHGTDTSPH